MLPSNVSSIDQKRQLSPDPTSQASRKKRRSALVPQTRPVRLQMVTMFVDGSTEASLAYTHGIVRESVETVIRQEWQHVFDRFPAVAAYYRNRRAAA